MKATWFRHLGVAVLACQLMGAQAHAVSWFPLGPYGGDARSFAVDPHDSKHLYLGTETGWVYQSHDGGSSWTRLVQIDGNNDLVIDHISIDPAAPDHMILAAFTLNRPGGGLYVSDDGGKHWTRHPEMTGQSVRSLTRAPSDPNLLIAGTLQGVYRSKDNGKHWELISPAGSTEIHEIESVAIDPKDPNIIYAGTTQGLYKSTDGGSTWVRQTGADVIVNDVYVDPNHPQHVLLATDRGGVLRSEDSGMTFQPSNDGFTLRQVVAYAADQRDPAQLYVGVVNDKEVGGVFWSRDGGVKWQQMSGGLGGRDVYSLAMTSENTLLAGTSHGVFRMSNGFWNLSSDLVPPPAPVKKPVTKRGGHAVVPPAPHKTEPKAASPLSTAAVYALSSGSAGIYAGTSAGVWRSQDGGQTWSQLQVPLTDGRFVASHERMIVATSLTGAALSENGGDSWTGLMPPATLTQVGALAIDGLGNIWIGGPEGVFYSTDRGASWKTIRNLFVRHVDGIFYDAANKRVLVASAGSTVGFAASLPDYHVSYWDTGWALRFLRPVGDHLVGATLFDGIVVEPRMVATPFPGDMKTEHSATRNGGD